MENRAIESLTTCIDELGYEHQFYFDAHDVIDILKGVRVFYESDSGAIVNFQKSKFDNKNRIVQSLAYKKLLADNICLLPPHQAELADKINTDISNTEVNKNLYETFWKNDLKFFDKFKEITDIKHKDIDKKLLGEWVSTRGKDIIKAVAFSSEFSWEQRLVKLFSNTFKLEVYKLDDIDIEKDEYSLFYALMDLFNKIPSRINKLENNYRDSLALVYLSRQVKLFNNGNLKKIPVFFDSQNYSNLISDVILNNYFKIKLPGKVSLPNTYALRSSDYFEIYSLINFNNAFPDEDNKYRAFINNTNQVNNIKTGLDSIRLRENIFGTRSDSQSILNKDKRVLEREITEYINYDFFKTITLKMLADEDTVNSIIKNVSLDHSLLNGETIEKIKDKVNDILSKIGRHINELVYSSAKAYSEIEERVGYLRKVAEELNKNGITLDIFFHYSLFRFFIPIKYQKGIKIFFSADGLLAKNKNSDTYRAASTSLWELNFRAIKQEKSLSVSLDEEELFTLFCSFWILNLHEHISRINVNHEKLHHSLLMLLGACLNRAITNIRRDNEKSDYLLKSLNQIIFTLSERIKTASLSDYSYGELGISLAYLYFQLWLQQGNKTILENNYYEDLEFNSGSYNYKAIDYAKKSFYYFDSKVEKENKHRVYALNLYIYYVIDSAPLEEFEKIENLIKEFIRLKGIIHDWHFRYDDTIARNFHRLSLSIADKSTKINMATAGLNTIQKAIFKLKILQGRDINEVEAYELTLQNYIGNISKG